MTLQEFRTKFPEFREVGNTQIQDALDEASGMIDSSVWGGGTRYTRAIGYLAAHQLALSPFGQNSRMVAQGGSTTYYQHYLRLQMQVTQGFRVAE